MKMFFTFLPAAVLAITLSSCEGVIRRQIWPGPGNPNFFWNGPGNDNGPRDFFNNDVWFEPPRFDQPARFDRPSRNQNDIRDDFNFGDNNFSGGNDRGNQNSRPTTENSWPTTTPRTIHVAPQGCECPMTQQFNPVCGTDGNTYRNKGLLNCYARCGSNVSQKRLGTC